MDINVIQIRGGNSVNSKSIGTWTAGLDSPIMVKDEEAIKNLTADTVYRIFTVVVRNMFVKLIFSSKQQLQFPFMSLASTVYHERSKCPQGLQRLLY